MRFGFFTTYLSDFLLSMPIVGLLYLFKRLTPPLKLLLLYCLVLFVVEIFSIYLARTYHYNLWLYNIYFPIEAGLLTLFFCSAIHRSLVRKILLYVGGGIVVLNTYLYNAPGMGDGGWINGFLTILLCLCFFWEILRKRSHLPVTEEPLFWIITGFLMYAAGSYFVFVFKHLVFVHNNELAYQIDVGRMWIFIVRSILFSIGIWYIHPTRRMKNILLICGFCSVALAFAFTLV